MNNIKTFVSRLNDIENAPLMAKALIYSDNTAIDVIAKVLVSTLYDTAVSNTLDGMNREIAEQLLDLLDAIIWAFAEKCDAGCVANDILKKADNLKNAVYDEYMQD